MVKPFSLIDSIKYFRLESLLFVVISLVKVSLENLLFHTNSIRNVLTPTTESPVLTCVRSGEVIRKSKAFFLSQIVCEMRKNQVNVNRRRKADFFMVVKRKFRNFMHLFPK